MRTLLILSVLVAAASALTLNECKNAYAAALAAALTNDGRCKGLIGLSQCLTANLATFSHTDRLSAQGFFDAAKLVSACGAYNVPAVNIATVSEDNYAFVKVPADSDINLYRERSDESLSIWDVNTKFDALVSNTINREDFDEVKASVRALQTGNTNTMGTIRDEILDIVETRLGAITNQIDAAMDATLASLKTITASMNDVSLTRVAKIEADLKDIGSNIFNDVITRVSADNSAMRSTLASVSTLASSMSGKVNNIDGLVSTTIANTIGDVKPNVDKLWAALGKTHIVDRTIPVFRYASWSSYAQSTNWFCDNNPIFFGGVAPSTWTDSNGVASSMSSDKNILRTLFNKKMSTGWNANVVALEWYFYSSTNSQMTGVLFRIRNTTPAAITWTPYFYYSSYNSWGEAASVAVNGVSLWTTSNNCAFCTASVGVPLPANRISTVIVISASGVPSTTRSNILVFYQDSLKLPAGLEYMDDLDYATGGWEA